MKSARMASTVRAAAICMAMAVASSVRAQVLQQVPSDALVVIKINNLKATSDKIAKFGQDLGIAQFLPTLADPLGGLQVQTKIQQGLDTAGELAIVIPSSMIGDMMGNQPPVAGENPGEKFFVLLPVSDYKAFLGNFPGAKTDGPISEVKLGDGGDTGYVANWGNYAALSPTKSVISTPPSAKLAIPAVSMKELTARDASVYLNVAALKEKTLPQLQQARTMALRQVDQMVGRQPQFAKMAPVAHVAVEQLFNVVEGYLNNTQGSLLGLTITPDGLNTTLLTEFKPGTYPAENIASIKNTSDSLLTGLPPGKYLAYGGAAADGKAIGKLISDFADPIVAEATKAGPELAPIKTYFESFKAAMAATNQQTFGLLAPSGTLGKDALLQIVSIQTGEPAAMASSYTQMMQSQQDAMKAFGLPGTDLMKMNVAPASKTLDGVTFDTITMTIDANPQNPMAAQQQQMMQLMYGPGGFLAYAGNVGNQRLTLMGMNDAAISNAITALKAKSTVLADNDTTKAVAAQLPKDRIAVYYVPLGDIISTALLYARQFGFAMPVQLPPDLPPIGVTVATEGGTTLRTDVHISTTLVQSLVAAGMQGVMQMQGGGPGGPGAGGGL